MRCLERTWSHINRFGGATKCMYGSRFMKAQNLSMHSRPCRDCSMILEDGDRVPSPSQQSNQMRVGVGWRL